MYCHKEVFTVNVERKRACYFFFSIYFYQLEANYFKTFQWVLSYIDMNPPWIYMYPPSRLPIHPIPLRLPSAPGPSTCLMHPTWVGDLLHLDNIHVSVVCSTLFYSLGK